MRRIQAKTLLTPSAATFRKRRRKLDLILGQEKILKYFRVQEKSAISQKGPLGFEEGKFKGVILARGLPECHPKEAPAPHLRKKGGRGVRRKEKEKMYPGNVVEHVRPKPDQARKTSR